MLGSTRCKANHVEVNVAVVNISSRNMVAITALKKKKQKKNKKQKTDIAKVFREFNTRKNDYQLPNFQRVKTSNTPMFLKICVVGMNLKK